MELRKRLIDTLEPSCAGHTVRDVRIGLGYTAVQIDDGRAGVAYTLARGSFGGCSAFTGTRPLSGRPVADLLRYLSSESLVESSLGLATANALANAAPSRGVAGDVSQVVELLLTDRVAMVGFFAPLVAALQDRVADLEIFEEHSGSVAHLRPSSDAVSVIPTCDVALITATSIVNDTIDELLEAARHCRESVVLGPSTPLIPDVFEPTAVTWLSGMAVHDAEGLLQVVSEGGGTRFFKPFVSKWNVRLKVN
ncbi:MAG: DUF364 domain-containing protein [Desulfomonile tiedjei]|nr:DUF364 domain-containing protein [Desulfomonile tiedjei]